MGIVGVWGYAWSALSAFVTLGVAWYLLDRAYGVHVYRWFYDFFHKESMPADIVRGVMYNQPTNRKVSVAFVISTAQSAYMIWATEVNFLVELIMWLLEVPALLIGFAAGAWVHRFIVKRSVIFDRFDELGEDMKGADIQKVRMGVEGSVRSIVSFITSMPAMLLNWFWSVVYPTPKIPVAPKEPSSVSTPPVSAIDSREAFDRYTRRSR